MNFKDRNQSSEPHAILHKLELSVSINIWIIYHLLEFQMSH